MQQKNIFGFTLVELIVVITILSILTTIGYISLQGYMKDSRNANRATDSRMIMKTLQIHMIEDQVLPTPDDYELITYNGDTVVQQGFFGANARAHSKKISHVPLDPLTNQRYIYAINATKNEYEVLAIYEGLSVSNPIITQTYASEIETVYPKISGTYNKVYVETDNHIVPIPSLINSEITDDDLPLDNNNIDSFVVTGGENIPGVGDFVTAATQNLDITLSTFDGNLTDDSDITQRQEFVEALQTAYSGSTVVSVPQINTVMELDEPQEVDNFVLTSFEDITTPEFTGESDVSVSGPSFVHTQNISAGRSHTCAINSSKEVYCFGDGIWGRLGHGLTSGSPSPVQAVGISDAVSVAAGYYHSCALHETGEVSCWGQGNRGQMGKGSSDYSNPTPTKVTGITDAVSLTAGEDHSCVLHNGGSVSCWGRNDYSQIGDGTTDNALTPVTITGLVNIKQVSAGGRYTCILLGNDTVQCWGQGSYGRLGTGSYTDQTSPTAVSGITDVRFITTGQYHACAINNSDDLYCWGRGSDGRLGTGSYSNATYPSYVSLLSGVSSASAGGGNGCAMLNDGTAYCWGKGSSGQLGTGLNSSSSTPVTVSGVSPVEEIRTSPLSAACSKSTTGFKCWGNNGNGQLGFGSTGNQLSPVDVISF